MELSPPATAYCPLNARRHQVRLFHLEPTPTLRDEICGLFSIATLDLRPTYTALSYVWGDATIASTCYARVGQHKIPITSNLDKALRYLRYYDAVRVLWIDALCINQADLAERASQVTQMNMVYGIARDVLVWLGEGWNGSDHAMAALRQLAEDEALHLEPGEDPHLIVDGRWTVRNSPLGSDLYRLINLPWFHRLWTVQEYALGKIVTYQCGNVVMDSDTFEKAMEHMLNHLPMCCQDVIPSRHEDENGMNEQRSPDVKFDALLWNIVHLEDVKCSFENDEEFLIHAVVYRSRQVTDARDRIFALLGLASGSRKRKLPDVSYLQSVEETYGLFAINEVLHTRNLDILSCCYGERTLSLPSWVPDWTAKVADGVVWLNRYVHMGRYQASNGMLVSNEAKAQGNRLVLQGFICDTIKQSFDRRNLTAGYRALVHEFATTSGQQSTDEPTYAPTGQGLKHAFRLSLTGSLYPFALISHEKELQLQHHATAPVPATGSLTSTLSYPLIYDTFEQCGYPDKPPYEDFAANGALQQGLDRLSNAYRRTTKGREFVITEGGRFGWAPAGCRMGDKIGVLFGGNVPFVLRPRELMDVGDSGRMPREEYVLLGDAYIHGIMKGEVVREADKAGVAPDTVVLV